MGQVILSTRPITPVQALNSTTAGIPEFVVQTVNQLLVEAMRATYSGEMRLIVLESTLKLRLEEAAHDHGVTLSDEMWQRFPYLYADKWDILVPTYTPNQQPHYVFSPKGVRRMQPEETH